MHVKGFTFYTLKFGHVTHFGYKTASGSLVSAETEFIFSISGMHKEKNKENKQNYLNYEQIFKPILRKKYPESKRECLDNTEQLKNRGRSSIKL